MEIKIGENPRRLEDDFGGFGKTLERRKWSNHLEKLKRRFASTKEAIFEDNESFNHSFHFTN